MAGTPYDNIRPQWNRVTSRLQSKGCTQNGYAVVSIRILVGPDGNPVFWSEPDMVLIEPKNGLDRIMTLLLAIDKPE